jgi:hypothetical protein
MKSIREYAAENGFEIVGKLTRKVDKREKFNIVNGEMETVSTIYWEDEAGNTYTKGCITTADGAVI